MVADEVDYVLGVDTHRDEHVLAVVVPPAGAVVAQRTVSTNGRGYGQALRFAQQYANGAVSGRLEVPVTTVPPPPATCISVARRSLRRAARRGASGACAGRTTSSTRSAPHEPRSRVSRWRCHGRDSAAKR